jgi:thiol-activated cytolysin
MEARYEEILERSTVEVITLGGGAEAASEAVTARSAGDLEPIITGENAVYSRGNPGVPISYAVKYLKDDQLAKLGYTTEYTATECSSVQTENTITVNLKEVFVRADCDGITKGVGEFQFRAIVNGGGTREGDFIRGRPEVELGDGDRLRLNEEVVFDMDRRVGNQFAITFYSTEWDEDFFGQRIKDKRMATVSNSKRHTFGSTGWSNVPPGDIRIVNGGSGCQAELVYSVEVI